MQRPETIKEMLGESFTRYKDNVAFVFFDMEGKTVRITYDKLRKDVEALCLALIFELKAEGEKAAIICHNCYEWCLVYLACLCTGIVVVPVDREISGGDIGEILDFAKVRLVFSDKKSGEKLAKRPEVKYITIDGEGEGSFLSLLVKGEALRREGFEYKREINKDDLAVLIFTSGTTGNPKGVMLSNYNLCSDLYLVRDNVGVGERDRSLSVLPLHHTYEAMALLMMLYCGASVAFCGGIRYLGKSFSLFMPTVFVTVPLILEKLHGKILCEIEAKGMRQKFRLASFVHSAINEEKRKKLFSSVHSFFGGKLKKIVVGAAPLNQSVAEDFELFGFKVIIGYGLTECSPIVICNGLDERSTDSVGRPLKEVEVKIHKPDEKGIGELLVKGPMVMKGYYQNEKATSEVFLDSWLRTGDLGYKDKNGRYYITGRCKNVIVTRNGKNIYPEELEYKLSKNPFIRESLVYGEKGDIVACEILPDLETISRKLKKKQVSDEEVKALINEAVRSVNRLMPSYKRIKKVTVRKDEFLKTTTHKIKRKY